jgi:hypothetical protein
MISNGTADSLPDPPGGICAEFEITPVIEFLNRAN